MHLQADDSFIFHNSAQMFYYSIGDRACPFVVGVLWPKISSGKAGLPY